MSCHNKPKCKHEELDNYRARSGKENKDLRNWPIDQVFPVVVFLFGYIYWLIWPCDFRTSTKNDTLSFISFRSHQMYYMFGFLFLVFIILLITCSEATVLLCYFHLCAEVKSFSVANTFQLEYIRKRVEIFSYAVVCWILQMNYTVSPQLAYPIHFRKVVLLLQNVEVVFPVVLQLSL